MSDLPTPTVLVDQLLAVDGHLVTILDPPDRVRACYRSAIHWAKESGLVPDGLKLRYKGRDAGDLTIWLAEPGSEPLPPPAPVPVPAALRSPHLLIAEWMRVNCTDAPLPEVSQRSTGRALRILQGLFVESERRGYTIAAASTAVERRRGQTSTPTALFEVGIDRERYEFSLHEEYDRAEVEEAPAKYEWQRSPLVVRKVPSGRLVLTSHAARSLYWADRKRWTLDDKLGHALADCERRSTQAAKNRAEATSKAERALAEWEKAVDEAQAAHIEDLNRRHLLQLVEDASTAAGIRDFLDRISDHVHSGPGGVTAEWVAWARDSADQIDPGPEAARFAAPGHDELTSNELDRWMPNGWTAARPPKDARSVD